MTQKITAINHMTVHLRKPRVNDVVVQLSEANDDSRPNKLRLIALETGSFFDDIAWAVASRKGAPLGGKQVVIYLKDLYNTDDPFVYHRRADGGPCRISIVHNRTAA